MRIPRNLTFERTDIWREGKWLDLWSVVHFLSGTSIGLGFYFLHFGSFASVALALLSLISYEMWEAMVRIEETPMNRFMDVVVGMTGYLPAFFLLAPGLSEATLILTFGLVFFVDVVMSAFGWRASRKAAELEKRMREQYAIQRASLLRRSAQLREKYLPRKKPPKALKKKDSESSAKKTAGIQ
jgi:hypothetical protein